ncbi:YidC/Oxa1 family membrane protein insertase [Bengtsoniella intestinalis]|uniref:YidC/Oxa1 family membrane protein insertase n=1 Tax=Bengtsoniella intestinalis TaxID=3073143 RepID=UPI00391F18AE
MLIPIVSGALSFCLSKITMATQSSGGAQQAAQMKTMTYMMPLMSVYIGFILPAALGVYWISQSAISIVQEYFVGRYFTKKFQAEEDERDIQRAADRQKRMEEGRARQEAQNKESQRKAASKKKAAVSNANQPKVTTTQEGRLGNRPYARGRAYDENRYNK